jgi:hypothetical protein
MKSCRFLVTSLITCVMVSLVTPSVAQADNTTCANADYIFPGERAQYTIGATANLYFKTRVTAGRSYAVLAWGPFQDASEGGVGLDASFYSNDSCSLRPAGNLTKTPFEPSLQVSGHHGSIETLIPTADGTVYIWVSNTLPVGYTVHVLFMETTLFSPWWFTGGTNQAYIELRNNMDFATVAQLTLYRADGSQCGTSLPVIQANGNAALAINTVGTCAAAVSGSAQISFPGTPGGMTANITTIDVPNGTSFDAPFTPRMVWGTFSR